MRWSGQGHTGQEHEPSALHPAITTSQHNRRLDGTSTVPWRCDYRIMLGVDGPLLSRIRIVRITGLLWLRAVARSFVVGRLSLGEHDVQLFDRDTQGISEFRPTPRLRTGLATFPAPDGGGFDAHDPRQRFLAVSDNLTALRERAALGSHGSWLPVNGLIQYVIGTLSRRCDHSAEPAGG
jgi:hypothetical protein